MSLENIENKGREVLKNNKLPFLKMSLEGAENNRHEVQKEKHERK